MTRPRAPAPVATGSAADFIPPNPTLPKLKEAARKGRGCHLWVNATQTVFGEGSAPTDVMLVGKQPGDQEDRVGRPFVGPAGKLLDAALEQAGIDRRRVYVTNAVTRHRGESISSELADAIIATVRPSAVLRAPEGEREGARSRRFSKTLRKWRGTCGRSKRKWPARGEASRPLFVR